MNIENVQNEYRTKMEKALITLLESKWPFTVRRESGKIFYDGYIHLYANVYSRTIVVDLATEKIEFYLAYELVWHTGTVIDDINGWTLKFYELKINDIENLINNLNNATKL